MVSCNFQINKIAQGQIFNFYFYDGEVVQRGQIVEVDFGGPGFSVRLEVASFGGHFGLAPLFQV